MKKFYFIATLINLSILILVILIVFPFTENMIIDNSKRFFETNYYVEYSFYFYFFIFWWAAPLLILLIKDYTKHLYCFISINVLLGLFIFIKSYNFDMLWSYILLFLVPSNLISVLTYYLQRVLGKRLLPIIYKKT